MAVVLMPLPNQDFDPTETGIPWKVLSSLGHEIVFATEGGTVAAADPMMVTGRGLGILAGVLRAAPVARQAYDEMSNSGGFRAPLSWDDIDPSRFDALILAGGHAKGMRQYLESRKLQTVARSFFEQTKPVGAICHGVVLAARSKRENGQSVLHGRKTTALTRAMELTAWRLTQLYLGDYYRTYTVTVEDEVRAALEVPADFVTGPLSLTRDSDANPDAGFVVRDGNYLSARWPGDAHRFAYALHQMLGEKARALPSGS